MAPSYVDQLNPAQREAVTHGEGPLLVVAGAGTGKTKTLASRVAYLLDQGIHADRILLLTFTRRAAAEMLRRAGQMCGREGALNVWGGTFHAVANRLIRVCGRAAGLPADFTVIDESDAADLMNLVRGDLGVARRDRRFPKKETLVRIYSRMVNAQEKLESVLERHFPWCTDDIDDIRRIFQAYVERKRAGGVMDYDDLLLAWQALCRQSDVGDRFDHILVDEFQDTNAVQGEILVGMRRTCRNIMAVGDDAQSIYSFRAATVRNMLDFPRRFEGTRIVTLEQNYRSTQPILAASNAVMSFASERFAKDLRSERVSPQRPVVITCEGEAEQSAAVCRNILLHLERGVPLMRQAVLFRAAHHSDHLEVELKRRRIPFHKYGGLKFVEAAHIKDVLALLRILENPFDELSWYRVLLLLEGIGPRRASQVIRALTGDGEKNAGTDFSARVSPLARLFAKPPAVPLAARDAFVSLRLALADCCGVRRDQMDHPPASPGGGDEAVPLASQIERLRLFYEPLLRQRYENPRPRERDLDQLEQIAAGYRSRRSFITDLTLDPPAGTADLAGAPYLEEDYLTLSTIHSAKGCEWDVVHIIHVADGMIPSDMALSDKCGLEEERRLLYVAMTRARNMLYLSFPLRYYHRRFATGDGHHYAQLTRFIPPEIRHCFECRTVISEFSDMPSGRRHGLRDVQRSVERLL